MGIKGSPTRELYFTDCTIPADRMIGEPGTGFKTALRTLDFTRPTIGAQAVGIAQGALDATVAYVKDRRLHFPLLADFHPKGAMARSYGAYRDADGFCERALFVIDHKGVIFWSYCSPVAINPGADGILDALEKIADKEHSNVHTASPSHV